MIGIGGFSVSTENEDYDIAFLSADNSVYLHHHDSWWAIDTVNDRGHRYTEVFSVVSCLGGG